MDQNRIDVPTGIFAGLIVMFLFGLFIGLPIIGWFLLIAAFVGLFVATSKRRANEREQAHTVPTPRRPWDKE